MKVALAADHAGYPLKEQILALLKAEGYDVHDFGTDDPTKPADYPDFAEMVCTALMEGQAERGIVVCGSGVGVTVAANKFPGIRASMCHDNYSAHQGVEHDDMNVLCVGARIIGAEPAKEIVRSFLKAKFTGEERHTRRLNKVKAIESKFLKS